MPYSTALLSPVTPWSTTVSRQNLQNSGLQAAPRRRPRKPSPCIFEILNIIWSYFAYNALHVKQLASTAEPTCTALTTREVPHDQRCSAPLKKHSGHTREKRLSAFHSPFLDRKSSSRKHWPWVYITTVKEGTTWYCMMPLHQATLCTRMLCIYYMTTGYYRRVAAQIRTQNQLTCALNPESPAHSKQRSPRRSEPDRAPRSKRKLTSALKRRINCALKTGSSARSSGVGWGIIIHRT